MDEKSLEAGPQEAGIMTKNKCESIIVNNDGDLEDIVRELMIIKTNSEKAAFLTLKWEPKKIVEIVRDIGDIFTDVDRHDMELHPFESLRRLLEIYTDDKDFDHKTLKAIYFVFEFSLMMIASDVDEFFELIFLGELRNQAVGLSVIGEGIADGARFVLSHGDDDDNFDDDNPNDNNDNDRIKEVRRLCEKTEKILAV